MAAGNRKSSNKRKTQTKKERMAEMEKAQAFRVEVTSVSYTHLTLPTT